MQAPRVLSSDSKAATREIPAGAHLPFTRHLDDATILTRDGYLMQTIRVGGLLFETADSADLNYRAGLRDAMLRAIGTSRFAVYHHIIRRRVDADLEGEFPDAFSRQLDARWRERCERRQLYVNELFLTLVRRPMPGRNGIADRIARLIRSPSPTANAAALRGELASLNNAREALMAALAQYDPTLLTRYESEDGGTRSEPLEFLSCLFNGDMRPVAEPHGDLGMHLPTRRISFGRNTVELAPAGPQPRRFVALVSIKDWPSQTMPGMFDELLRLPFEMHVAQSPAPSLSAARRWGG